jgi:hypothetical protein
MYKNSVYTKIYSSNDKVKETGFNYRNEGMIDKFLSNRMFGNPVMDGFLSRMEPYFVEMTDSVKTIQFYNNYTLDKNDGSINL